MIRLERRCPTAAHWTGQQYEDLFGHSGQARLVLVAEQDDASRLSGFLIARHVSPEWELENIVVAEECRGKGLGTQLMLAFLREAEKSNGESVFLEVRESNDAAKALYEKVGFRQTGRRKSYYTDPLEDAILYAKTLRPKISG